MGLRISSEQVKLLECSRVRESVRIIELEIQALSEDWIGALPPDQRDQAARDIAQFCSEFLVIRSENLRRITRAHMARRIIIPDHCVTAPLRRSGFSEDERVNAYVYALEHKLRWLVLDLKSEGSWP